MADFKLIQNENDLTYDLAFEDNDFVLDEGLETSVIISLFSDRRVKKDELPQGVEGLRGWFGDTFEGEKLGSKLWLLFRAKETQQTENLIGDYAKQALNWMQTENVAKEVAIDVGFPERGLARLEIDITKPTGEEITFRFDQNWEAQIAPS
jgi:phage gp46-like protein